MYEIFEKLCEEKGTCPRQRQKMGGKADKKRKMVPGSQKSRLRLQTGSWRSSCIMDIQEAS